MSDPLLSPRDLALVDAVAVRVLELLAERGEPAKRLRLVSAGELAEILGVSRETVYQHRAALGARHVGDGERPRLRFDVDQALGAWSARQPSGGSQPPVPPAPAGRSPRPRRRSPASDVPLLPVKGSQASS